MARGVDDVQNVLPPGEPGDLAHDGDASFSLQVIAVHARTHARRHARTNHNTNVGKQTNKQTQGRDLREGGRLVTTLLSVLVLLYRLLLVMKADVLCELPVTPHATGVPRAGTKIKVPTYHGIKICWNQIQEPKPDMEPNQIMEPFVLRV